MSELIQSLKNIFLFVFFITLITSCGIGSKENRPSPYATDSTTIGSTKLAIKYSSPGVKKREIWGELVPFGNMWRTGANEATVLSTTEDIKLNGQLLPKGKYAIFTIPDSHKWTIIFNSDWNQWGAYNYDESLDALRLEIQPQKVKDHQERMKFSFEKNALKFHWENLQFQIALDTVN